MPSAETSGTATMSLPHPPAPPQPIADNASPSVPPQRTPVAGRPPPELDIPPWSGTRQQARSSRSKLHPTRSASSASSVSSSASNSTATSTRKNRADHPPLPTAVRSLPTSNGPSRSTTPMQPHRPQQHNGASSIHDIFPNHIRAASRSAPNLTSPSGSGVVDKEDLAMEVIGLYQTEDTIIRVVPSGDYADAHDASLSSGSSGTFATGQNRRGSGMYHEPIPVPTGKTNRSNNNHHSPILSSSAGSGNLRLGTLSPSTASKSHPLFVPGSFASSTWSNFRSSPGTSAANARDRYGFRKQSQYITLQEYDDWWTRYDKHSQRRYIKWEALIEGCGIPFDEEGVPISFPPKSKKVKRYVRKGIPAEWRGAAWFWYARGHDYLRDNYGLYDRLWQQGMVSPPPDSELIERDLHRTFPDNMHFRNADWQNGSVPSTPGSTGSSKSTASSRRNSNLPEMPIVQALRRVLLAFSLYVPKTGYCQSLNFVAGLLLLFMEEEKAFWMLVIITQKYLPGMHEINLEGANIDQGVLMMCVKESLPTVWNKIGAGLDGFHHDDMIMRLPPITLCTAAWFMSGFIGVLPIESVVRVWDCFFYDDSKVFFRIALTIFKLGESQVDSVRDPMEIFQVVQTVPKHLLDANALIQACFRRRNGFGHISQDEINERRKFVAEKRRFNTSSAADGSVSLGTKADVVLSSSAVESSDLRYLPRTNNTSRYKHYDAITGAYHSKSNFGKRMQLLRMGSTNMLSLHARNDYFGTSHSQAEEHSAAMERNGTTKGE
ncbi:hypothetical protein V1508DRAFT_440200 [Lipomyces doorenjongii]|uniref:uncharacterized protein n=1 Tax=Lipomyces doorenjongii TaxID=383834 RepID=UPI0034CFAE7E